jgi:hypothetical protein
MSITVTILTGLHAGESALISDNFNPTELLGIFAQNDIHWDIDCSHATNEEFSRWGRSDLVARILAALYHGRWIRFQDKSWTARHKTDKEIKRIVGEIENALSHCGMNIYMEQDSEQGVTIGTYRTDHSVQ